MCDTIAATGSATADGITLFGKNSDREPNEAQNLCHNQSGCWKPLADTGLPNGLMGSMPFPTR